VLARIKAGGPFRYERDGVVFGNREHQLPSASAATITSTRCRTPARRTAARGASCAVDRRPRPTACYYTGDHYETFARIRE
jgi:ribonuclease T1